MMEVRSHPVEKSLHVHHSFFAALLSPVLDAFDHILSFVALCFKELIYKVNWHALRFSLFQSAACTNIETVASQL